MEYREDRIGYFLRRSPLVVMLTGPGKNSRRGTIHATFVREFSAFLARMSRDKVTIAELLDELRKRSEINSPFDHAALWDAVVEMCMHYCVRLPSPHSLSRRMTSIEGEIWGDLR